MYKESREKLVEKNISWHEEYTDKTKFLKDQFHDVVGPGSYYRFEGRAPDGDEYYCIVGPAKVHHPRAKFFAGVRKLPATYSAGGKYFDSLDTAAKYAKETWGVPTPASLIPYTSRQLFGISKKVHDWKEKREEEEKKGKKKDKDDKDDDKSIEAFNIDVITKEAMGAEQKNLRTGYVFHTYEAIVSKKVKNFEDLIKDNPSFIGALNEIKDEKRLRYTIYSRKYGFSPEKMREMFRTYIGYSRHHGLYAIYVGPYLMAPKQSKEFYNLLHKAGLLPDEIYNDGKIRYGMDIPRSVLIKVLDHKNQKLKKLAGLYHTDLSGKFQTFEKPYHVPSYVKGWQEIDEHVKKQGLDIFNEYDEVDNVMQAKNMKDKGTPLAQKFGLNDYSYCFNYRTTYRKTKTEGTAQNFPKHPYNSIDPEGNTYWYGFSLPANHRKDSQCQTYSFNNYEEAKTNNMIISQSGTRIFLNRDGFKKVVLNMIATNPQYNERLMDHMRNNTPKLNDVKKNGTTLRHAVTKDLSSFLYFLLGVGEMDEEGIQAVKNNFMNGESPSDKVTNNGVLNLDDYKQIPNKKTGKMVDVRCGLNVFRSILAEIMNFYKKAIGEDSNTIKLSRVDCIDEETASLLAKGGFTDLTSVKEADDITLMKTGLSIEVIQSIKSGLDFLGDSINEIDPATRNELREHNKRLCKIHRLFCLKNKGPVKNVYATEEDKVISHLTYLDSVSEDTAKLLYDGSISTIKSLQKAPKQAIVAMGISENIADEISAELMKLTSVQIKAIPSKAYMFNQGGFLKPKGALANTPLLITSKAKNEKRLLSEIANFMASQNLDTLNDKDTELVVAYLNSGGDSTPEWYDPKKNKGKSLNHQIQHRINHEVEDDYGNASRKVYFFRENVKPLMAKVLSSKIESDLIDFCTDQNVTETSEASAEIAVSYLESKGYKDYFNTENVMGILGEAIYKSINGGKDEFGSDITSIARKINRQAVLMQNIYREERVARKNAEYIADKDVTDKEEEESKDLNLVFNDLCPKCGVKGDVSEHGENLVGVCPSCSTQFAPRLESFDTHNSFHEALEQICETVETLSYKQMEKSDKLIDPVTKAVLISIDDEGFAEGKRASRIFHTPPKGNMRATDLKLIFEKMSEEDKEKYRLYRSDSRTAELLFGTFNSPNMDILGREEYGYQMNISGEIDEEMNLQIAVDSPVDEEGNGEEEKSEEEIIENEGAHDGEEEKEEMAQTPDVTIDNEVENIENPEDSVEQPLNPPPDLPAPQPTHDPFANLNIIEEEGFENMIDEEEEDKKLEASKEVINNLLKLSQELDDEGKETESKELLRLAKKFSGNIRKG
jgi:hypothetical protein